MTTKLNIIDENNIPLIENYNLISTKENCPEITKLKRNAVEEYRKLCLSNKPNFFETEFLNSKIETPSIKLPNIEKLNTIEEKTNTFVFLNGQYNADLSMFDETIFKTESCSNKIGSITKENYSILSTLNTAYINTPVFIKCTKKTNIPLHIIYMNTEETNNIIFPRVFVEIEKDCETIQIIESIINDENAKGLQNINSEIEVHENTNVEHKIISTSNTINSITSSVKHHGNGEYNFYCTTENVPTTQIEHDVTMGANTKSNIRGAIEKFNHFNYNLRIEHIGDDSESNILVKVIAEDNANAKITGDIVIPKNIHNVDSSQVLKCLLLSKKTNILLEPLMHVESDDVKADHGSALGPLDQDSLFYLKSKGIDPENATLLLKEAFLSECKPS